MAVFSKLPTLALKEIEIGNRGAKMHSRMFSKVSKNMWKVKVSIRVYK